MGDGHLPPRPLLLIALAGSDLQLLLQRRQSLGCNGSGANRGDLLAGFQGFKDRTRLQRSGHIGPVRWRELLRSLTCSVALDGEVIWKGSGSGSDSRDGLRQRTRGPQFRPRRLRRYDGASGTTDVATGTSVWQGTAGPDAEIWSPQGGQSLCDVICFGTAVVVDEATGRDRAIVGSGDGYF